MVRIVIFGVSLRSLRVSSWSLPEAHASDKLRAELVGQILCPRVVQAVLCGGLSRHSSRVLARGAFIGVLSGASEEWVGIALDEPEGKNATHAR